MNSHSNLVFLSIFIETFVVDEFTLKFCTVRETALVRDQLLINGTPPLPPRVTVMSSIIGSPSMVRLPTTGPESTRLLILQKIPCDTHLVFMQFILIYWFVFLVFLLSPL